MKSPVAEYYPRHPGPTLDGIPMEEWVAGKRPDDGSNVPIESKELTTVEYYCGICGESKLIRYCDSCRNEFVIPIMPINFRNVYDFG